MRFSSSRAFKSSYLSILAIVLHEAPQNDRVRGGARSSDMRRYPGPSVVAASRLSSPSAGQDPARREMLPRLASLLASVLHPNFVIILVSANRDAVTAGRGAFVAALRVHCICCPPARGVEQFASFSL